MSIELKIMATNGSDLVDRVKDLFETFFKPDTPKAEPATVPEKLDEVVKEAVSIAGVEPPREEIPPGFLEALKAVPEDVALDIFPATDQVGDKPAESKKFDLEKDLRPRTKALHESGKVAELKALFDKFGCVSVGKLKPAQFADFMSESEKLL
jgi:hypothetical protein